MDKLLNKISATGKLFLLQEVFLHQSRLSTENENQVMNSEAISQFQNISYSFDVFKRLQSGLLNQNEQSIAYDL